MSTHSPHLGILNEGKRRETKVNISTSFPPIFLILFTLQMRGKRGEEKIFNSSHFTSPPSPIIIYSNKVSIYHLSFLPFPSLFQSKQSGRVMKACKCNVLKRIHELESRNQLLQLIMGLGSGFDQARI